MNNKQLKKKLWIGVPVVSFILSFLLFGAWVFGRKYLQQQFQEQMDLGNRYMAEQDYEAAVVAFNKAISLDPKQPEAYLNLSEAYIVLGDYEGAVSTLEKGYQYTSLQEMLDLKEFCGFLIDKREIISQITELIQNGSREGIWEYMSQDDYQEFITHIKQVLMQKIGEKYLLFYPCGHCYYGDMDEGSRSGQGIWCSYDYEQADYFKGLWENDYPNGRGEYWTASLALLDDLFYYHANWKDGYEEGMVDYEYTTYDIHLQEISTVTFSYPSTDGRPERVNDLHPEQQNEKGWYCFYSDAENSYYTQSNGHRGILHVRKSMDAKKAEMPVLLTEIEDKKNILEEKIEENMQLRKQAKEEAKNGVKLITDKAAGWLMQYDADRQWFLVVLEYGKGYGIKAQIIDIEGKTIANGYADEIWLTDSGYAQMEYYYGETGERVAYEYVGTWMWEKVMYHDNPENIYAYAVSYDWNNQVIGQVKLGDNWQYWIVEAQSNYPKKQVLEETEDIICEETQTGYLVKSLEGIEIGYIKGVDPSKMNAHINGRIVEIRDKQTDICKGIYFCKL